MRHHAIEWTSKVFYLHCKTTADETLLCRVNLPHLSSGVSLFVMIGGIVTLLGASYCLRLDITEPRNFAREEGARHLVNKKSRSTTVGQQFVFKTYLRAFAKLRKATICFVMSVCTSVWVENSIPSGLIFVKFNIGGLSEALSKKNQHLQKSDKKNGYFTWGPTYICDNSPLGSS